MRQTVPLYDLPADCDQVVDRLCAFFERRGLRVVRSFDLQVARAAHPGCTCPHHGTAQCTCQMVVLLIYAGEAYPKAVLVVHGHDNRTHIGQVIQAAGDGDTTWAEGLLRQAFAPSAVT